HGHHVRRAITSDARRVPGFWTSWRVHRRQDEPRSLDLLCRHAGFTNCIENLLGDRVSLILGRLSRGGLANNAEPHGGFVWCSQDLRVTADDEHRGRRVLRPLSERWDHE